MAKKIKLTRPELKLRRDALQRFERYLPMLKLKQQQLQITLLEVRARRRDAADAVRSVRTKLTSYRPVLADQAGINIEALAQVEKVNTSSRNIAGVNVPVFEDAIFPRADYSLFATPPWVDTALADLRELNKSLAALEVIQREYSLLARELTKIIQRVNLFDKVKIPEAREAIRVIRIKLGDEMTAAVGRAKIAKAKLSEIEVAVTGQAYPPSVGADAG